MMTQRDPLAGLKRIPELYRLFLEQPSAVQQAYQSWWVDRADPRAAHRDTLEAFLGGYQAGTTRAPARRRTAA